MSIMLNRWALYPPGRVPLGVTVHVNEEDGDVNVETPSSLQVFNGEILVLMNSFGCV
jgi:hypothetical protein